MRSRFGAVLAAAFVGAAAHAGDGVIEINQTKALAGGVNTCDTPGFPVTICDKGSYLLTSDLVRNGSAVPDIVVSIAVPDVTLDLGGHGVFGDNVCQTGGTFWPMSCAYSGTAWGAIYGLQRTTVRNGRVAGNAGGVSVGDGSTVRDLIVSGNGGTGLAVGTRSIVSRVTVTGNLGHGVFCWGACALEEVVVNNNQANGIELLGPGSVRRATASRNGGAGIHSAGGAQISHFSSLSNGHQGVVAGDGTVVSFGSIRDSGWADQTACGLEASGGAGYHGVVITSNWGTNPATVCNTGAVNLGGNACQAGACP